MTFARLRQTVVAALVAALALSLPTAQVRQLSAAASATPAASAHAEHGSYSTDLTQLALAHSDHQVATQHYLDATDVRRALAPPVRAFARVLRHLPTTSAYAGAQGARAPPATR